MKITKIELSWFRGAAESAVLKTNDRSIAIYGDNGAGKSCFVDAVEYLLRDGRVEHLAHEYSGKRQEKALLNTHRPDETPAKVSITLHDDSKVSATIQSDGSSSVEQDGELDFLGLDCGRTVLRQDEVSNFVHSTKGEKYSVLLPLLGLGHLETAAENLRQLSKAVSKKAGLEAARTALESAKRRASGASDSAIPPGPEASILALCSDFVEAEHEHDLDTCLELVRSAISASLKSSSARQRQHVALESLARIDLEGEISSVRTAASELAKVADDAVQSRLKALRATDGFLSGRADEEEVACPACASIVPLAQFRSHVESELARLEVVEEKAEGHREAVRSLRAVADRVKTACKGADITNWAAELTDSGVPDLISRAADCHIPKTTVTEGDLERLKTELFPPIEMATDASETSPPGAEDLASAQEELRAATDLRGAQADAAAAAAGQAVATRIAELEARVRDEISSRSQAVIGEISVDVRRMWSTLHPGEPIEDITIHVPPGADKAIDVALKFYGKELASPRLTLSEGYRNSLGLCVFLAMALRTGATPIVLDDVIVSLDRGHRGMVADVLQSEFADRQVLLFTHDRDWHADLRQQLSGSAWTFRGLLSFRSPREGIRWSDRVGTFSHAREYLTSRPDTAANEARKVMDVELAIYAERLQLRLPFARGARNDRRTSHEFLQQMISDGRTRFQREDGGSYVVNTDAIESWEAVDALLRTWANRGSHSEDVSESEAAVLIDKCEAALDQLLCDSCSKPIGFAETRSGHQQCQCGGIRWK